MRSRLMVCALIVAAAACGGTRQRAPEAAAPELTSAQRRGQQLFFKFCHQCHPYGEGGLGPALNGNPAPMAAFRVQVRGGLGAMPAFPDALIADPDLDQLLAFVDVQREQRRE